MKSTQSKIVVGVFDSYVTAEHVSQQLVASGFAPGDIQVTSAETFGSDSSRGASTVSGSPEGHGTGGGIAGFFRNLFGARDDEDATYAAAVNLGAAVVSVYADEGRIETARDIIERNNPVDIETSSSSDRETAYAGTERAIPVVEEELRVGKREVQRGGIRVYSRIVEQPVEEQVQLREEHVRVERRNVDRPATAADFTPPEQVIEVTETVEEPVVSKQARVREEIVIDKESDTRIETVRDTVRHTDVDVEELVTDRRDSRTSNRK